MFIQVFSLPPSATNAYLVACPSTREAVLIDAPHTAYELVMPFVKKENYHLKMLWLTHSHWDHIADAKLCQEKCLIPIYIHPLDAPNLIAPGFDTLMPPMKIEGTYPDHALADGMLLKLGVLQFKVIHTPGHSPGSVCFYCAEENTLFAGDTLFKGSFGNVSFPTSQPKDMIASLSLLAQLPSDTKVFSGHGGPTTIKDERHWMVQAEKII
jgi:glyoxylase-like metal-dependent hydrolase (beta-lactamase superfamily II)